MWIFTKYGFFSVVANRFRPRHVLVRARRREHLQNLVNRFGKVLDHYKIQETPKSDYRFRIEVPRLTWEDVVAVLAEEITYTNFKDEVVRVALTDPEFVRVLHDVWVKMWDYQNQPVEEVDEEIEIQEG